MRILTIAIVLGAALAGCSRPADTAKTDNGGDRRVEALEGADSAASPNVDAAAATNQVQIPDYGPAPASPTPASPAPAAAPATSAPPP